MRAFVLAAILSSCAGPSGEARAWGMLAAVTTVPLVSIPFRVLDWYVYFEEVNP